jgi:hypothetical protein
MVQRGIDIYGITNAGGGFFADGGHNHGRKGFMILAGWVLNDSQILSKANAPFAEDGQHFYVTQADVDRVRPADREPYTAQMIGLPEWGFQHAGDPSLDSSKWDAKYRGLVGVSNMGPVLAARIMGVENLWNYPAIFEYMDRFYAIEKNNVSTSTNSIQPFVSSMWIAYRGTGSGITPPPPVTFAVNDRISTIRNTNVRATPSLTGNLLGVQVTGSLGTIVAGPIVADNFTWWQINYDSGVDGWSGEDNLAKSLIGPPGATAPLPPVGIQVQGDD